MSYLGTIPEPPPLPPRPIFSGFRLTSHHVKNRFDKDKLTMFLRKQETQNQECEPINQDHKNLHLSKSCTNEEIEESGTTRTEKLIFIEDKLKQAFRDEDRTSWEKICIYKVPNYLQGKDNKSYFPQTVSIGPYHHGKEQTKSMECHKWRAVNKALKRKQQSIKVFIDAMTALQEKARSCYEGPISLNRDEFIEMLVLDGCFVLELLRGVQEGFLKLGYDGNDPVFAVRGSMHSIQRDMIMLENQLPLFVLNRLLEVQEVIGSVAHLAVQFFDPLMPTGESILAEKSQAIYISVDPLGDLGELHCLDVFRRSLLSPKLESATSGKRLGELHCLDVFCRSFLSPKPDPASSPKPEPASPGKRLAESHCLDVFCPSSSSPKPEPASSGKRSETNLRVADKRLQHIVPTVTELRDAGFQFKVRKTDRFWDIKFNNGYLEIPSLHIHYGTKSLFLNLIAFEQCHIDSSNGITSYIIFMDNLIDSPEDISYLHQRGIIEHSLESNSEVANMFNQLCQEVVFNNDDIYLVQLLTEVLQCYNQNCFRKWNAWKTTLKHKYFDNPWAYFSFFAAVVLLILTFFQTYFAAYAHFTPAS